MNYQTRWYHYIIVIFVYLIILVITSSFIYNFTLDPWYRLYLRIPITSLFIFTVIMIVITHTHAMMSNNAIEQQLHNSDDNNKIPDCVKCLSDRPQRSHHCRACNVCIRRMDHHCPWIANCVGEFNQKSFMLLLLYSILGLFIAFLCTMKAFIEALSKEKDISLLGNTAGLMSVRYSIRILLESMTMLSFILSGLMGLSICILLSTQINELKCGMTAIELKIYSKNDDCPYYNVDFKSNFVSLFGPNVLLWFFPMNTEHQDKDIQINTNYIELA